MNRSSDSCAAQTTGSLPASSVNASGPIPTGTTSSGSWLWVLDEVMPSEPVSGKRVLDALLAQLRGQRWPEQDIFGIHLSMEEALVNAIKHGNRNDASKSVKVRCQLSDCLLRIEISDEGPGFNPANVPDCTNVENLEVPCGRGIMLMRNFMSCLQYTPTGNGVIMEKQRTAG